MPLGQGSVYVRTYVCGLLLCRSSVIVLPGPAGMWLPLQSQTRPYPFHGRWRLQSRVPHPMGTSLPWSQVRVIHTHGRMYAHGHAMHTIVCIYLLQLHPHACTYVHRYMCGCAYQFMRMYVCGMKDCESTLQAPLLFCYAYIRIRTVDGSSVSLPPEVPTRREPVAVNDSEGGIPHPSTRPRRHRRQSRERPQSFYGRSSPKQLKEAGIWKGAVTNLTNARGG